MPDKKLSSTSWASSPMGETSGLSAGLGEELDLEVEGMLARLEKGHKICRIALGRRWEPSYRRLWLRRDTRQLLLSKLGEDADAKKTKPFVLDIRSVQEVQTLDFRTVIMKIMDKWRRDRDLAALDPSKILIVHHGSSFVLHLLLFLFDSTDAARLWQTGLRWLVGDVAGAAHPVVVDWFLRREFSALAAHASRLVPLRQMKPFVHTRLQYKITSKALQELVEEDLDLNAFSAAYEKLVFGQGLFAGRFAAYTDDSGTRVPFSKFLSFVCTDQTMAVDVESVGGAEGYASTVQDFLRSYVGGLDPARAQGEPDLSAQEFLHLLFSKENTVWVGDDDVMDDMTQPLSHYWINSSHNTYLTGDQLRSESSLDAYSRALLMGCRCIELDCWDGPKRGSRKESARAKPSDLIAPDDPDEFAGEVIIFHGYTMTSKLALRDVLHTIRHYAFTASEMPLILSIEDNCSLPFQRVLASDLKEILGDLLVREPVDRDETELPSPHALRRRIIVKHKKLPIESGKGHVTGSAVSTNSAMGESLGASLDDEDVLNREDFAKKGVLLMRGEASQTWSPHMFIAFQDRLYFTEAGDADGRRRGISVASGVGGEGGPGGGGGGVDGGAAEEGEEEAETTLPGVKPEEMHIAEEWFHGRISREEATKLLASHARRLGDGLFLVRESNTFIGDFSLSFWYRGEAHHCRIRTKMQGGEKRYYFLEPKEMDTLYELISYYTGHALATPRFRTTLKQACPQPCPHEEEEWFLGDCSKAKAEELLNAYREDGAFLLRHSSVDRSVFVLSIRVDGAIWHMRLKREGRIFLINQTIFENLCLLVRYFREHQLFRGVCLKYAVNEETVARYCHADASFSPEGCYLDINSVEATEELVVAVTDHAARDPDHLAFLQGDQINVMRKGEGGAGLWFGRTGGRSGWFDASAVRPVETEAKEGQEIYLSLAGSTIECVEDEERPFCLSVKQSSGHWSALAVRVSAASQEEREEWVNTLLDLRNQANDRASKLRSKEKQARIAAVLSELVVYCQAIPFTLKGAFFEMCSFSESKLDKLLGLGLAEFNQTRLSRSYPNASRVTSANFNPLPMWNAGVQMVALNFQTPDRPMQLNVGRFLVNRGCGYVLKPGFMMDEGFDPDAPPQEKEPYTLTLAVIAGRHLRRRDRARGGIVSPYVEVEVLGMPCDSKSFRTRTIAGNGLCPVWEETAEFTVRYPEAALLRFYVEDGDFVGPGTEPFVGQFTLPLLSIRSGFRSVPLRNEFSEELELSALLVHVRYDQGHSELPHMAAALPRAQVSPAQKPMPLAGGWALGDGEDSDASLASSPVYVNSPGFSESSYLQDSASFTSATQPPLPRKKSSSAFKRLFNIRSNKK